MLGSLWPNTFAQQRLRQGGSLQRRSPLSRAHRREPAIPGGSTARDHPRTWQRNLGAAADLTVAHLGAAADLFAVHAGTASDLMAAAQLGVAPEAASTPHCVQ